MARSDRQIARHLRADGVVRAWINRVAELHRFVGRLGVLLRGVGRNLLDAELRHALLGGQGVAAEDGIDQAASFRCRSVDTAHRPQIELEPAALAIDIGVEREPPGAHHVQRGFVVHGVEVRSVDLGVQRLACLVEPDGAAVVGTGDFEQAPHAAARRATRHQRSRERAPGIGGRAVQQPGLAIERLLRVHRLAALQARAADRETVIEAIPPHHLVRLAQRLEAIEPAMQRVDVGHQ